MHTLYKIYKVYKEWPSCTHFKSGSTGGSIVDRFSLLKLQTERVWLAY